MQLGSQAIQTVSQLGSWAVKQSASQAVRQGNGQAVRQLGSYAVEQLGSQAVRQSNGQGVRQSCTSGQEGGGRVLYHTGKSLELFCPVAFPCHTMQGRISHKGGTTLLTTQYSVLVGVWRRRGGGGFNLAIYTNGYFWHQNI